MKQILCFGDSNTYGYEPGFFSGGRYPAEIRWTNQLSTESRQAVNLGQNGRRIPVRGEFEAVNRLLKSYGNAELLIIMLGTNDILSGLSAAQVKERMRQFLMNLFQEVNLPVLLAVPPRLREGTWVDSQQTIDESIRLEKEFAALAEEFPDEIYFFSVQSGEIPMTSDGVHLTGQGHMLLGKMIREKTDRIMEKRKNDDRTGIHGNDQSTSGQ